MASVTVTERYGPVPEVAEMAGATVGMVVLV